MSHPLLYLAMNFAARKNVKLDYRRLARQNFEIFEAKKDIESFSQAEIQNVMVSK